MNTPTKLKECQLVTPPDVYDIPIKRYHSQCCGAPSISSAGIRRLLSSPAFMKFGGDVNARQKVIVVLRIEAWLPAAYFVAGFIWALAFASTPIQMGV